MKPLYTIISYDNTMGEYCWVTEEYGKGKYKVYATTDYNEAIKKLEKLISENRSNIHTYNIVETGIAPGKVISQII